MKGQTNAWLKDIVSGEKISIILTTNQSSHTDLVGAVITVSYAGNLTEYTWAGSAIQTVIPPMTDYTVSYSNVNGYSTPEPFSCKAMDGRVSEVIGTYNTEVVTVNVSAEEGEVSGYEIQISKVTEKTGLIPTGYTELEYIQSAGSSWIDTGVTPNQNTKAQVKLYMTATTGDVVIGHQGGESSSSDTIDWRLFNYSNKFYTDVNSQRVYGGTWSNNTAYNIEFGNNYLKDLDSNTTILSGTTESSFSHSVTIKVFKGLSTIASGRIYYLKIYDNNTLVRDYIPVKNSSGVAGLLDKVENKFYASGSSTAFTAGTVVGEITEEGIITDYETLYTQTTPSASYKIPYGTSYTIKAIDVSGYTTPATQSFTASQPSRNVDVTYSAALKGVFIQDIYGRLYTEDEWDGTQTANGIAVLTDKCEFVVAKEDAKSSSVYWGGSTTDISTLTNYTDAESAATDFDGIGNTAKIIAAIGYTSDSYRTGTAAGDCAEYTFPNGKTGYLGAAGEWQVARQNKDALNSTLTLIGGTTMTEAAYWTSTELEGLYACTQWFDSRDSLFHRIKSDGRSYVRAIAPYIANPKIISFTITGTNGTFQFQAIEGTNSHFWNQSAFCPTDDIYGYIGAFSTAWESGFIIEDGGAYRFSEPY